MFFNTQPLPINMYNTNIEAVEIYKYLGVHLDNRLKFKNQLYELNKKLCSTIPAFYTIREIFNKIKIILYSLHQ